VEDGRKGRVQGRGGRLGRVYDDGIRCVCVPIFFICANYLPVDQPAGTGFSYTSTDRFVHTLEEVSPCPFLAYSVLTTNRPPPNSSNSCVISIKYSQSTSIRMYVRSFINLRQLTVLMLPDIPWRRKLCGPMDTLFWYVFRSLTWIPIKMLQPTPSLIRTLAPICAGWRLGTDGSTRVGSMRPTSTLQSKSASSRRTPTYARIHDLPAQFI
jgi:hypothetical protein